MQALSRREEKLVMDLAHAEAETACREAIGGFAMCATGRTFSIAWACKDALENMRQCMRAAVPESRIDEMKRQFIEDRDSKKVEALEVYKKERIEAMKRHAGLKDGPKPAAATGAGEFVPDQKQYGGERI